MAKFDTLYLWTKWMKDHTFWGCTYAYNAYKGVPPPTAHSRGTCRYKS